ncbi:MAG TPA: ABC transporter ATP-binding protein [Acidimicrobiales bacterium]|nr:ABC transporter ATP-binding protein [Acidimicrobiales bacterium]
MPTADIATSQSTEPKTGNTQKIDEHRANQRGRRSPISVRGLGKAYGTARAVEDLSFDVEWRHVTGFLGPNGAGKSTTLKMLLGLVAPSSGEALVLGRRYHELAVPAVHVGALLETQQFHPGRTARAHLRVLAAAAGLPRHRVDEVLATVELAEDAGRRVDEYSLGMRQRLGLAAALLGEPKVLILDEPANGLDPAGIRWLRQLLRSFAQRGGAVLVSSHLLGEVSQLADEIVVINRGRLVVRTSVDELTRTTTAVRARSPERARLAAVLEAEGLEVTVVGDNDLMVPKTTPELLGSLAARAGVVLHGLAAETSSLEEVFFELTDSREERR